jgi:hypothetical protein
MRKHFNFLLILSVFIILWSCTDNWEEGPLIKVDLVYTNSFESANDTLGWIGLDTSFFKSEPSPGGGARSLLIGGGCIQPTAKYSMIIKQQGDYVLSCWGKSYQPSMSGIIAISKTQNAYDTESARIQIDSTDWKYNKSPNLYCYKGDTLNILIMVGGIKYDAVYIDNLKLECIIR